MGGVVLLLARKSRHPRCKRINGHSLRQQNFRNGTLHIQKHFRCNGTNLCFGSLRTKCQTRIFTQRPAPERHRSHPTDRNRPTHEWCQHWHGLDASKVHLINQHPCGVIRGERHRHTSTRGVVVANPCSQAEACDARITVPRRCNTASTVRTNASRPSASSPASGSSNTRTMGE